ncbi:IS66 family insertion sequence element accessory protein TnpB [Pedobacter sp. MC2016-05]|uniref:IS66 family insertion sequence element accessory protein TnpB n=1 Tax=Pedobacter sp. MC2016-05 TaxID=2994474 RepID=UPI00224795AF|nr:IS66 family insertion sequence element accessory protein TnpB [Pedobacter sp. MC2016-05]MCX2473741.1 IS66 family insertion sequence element accessory protein TnpB [Pedobacter sp. MC2016-05]
MSLLSLASHLQFYLFMGNADMRRTFEGLCGLVRNEMNQDPMNHQVYIFINKRRNQVKLLLWEGDGFCIYHKRLEAGTFERPVTDENKKQVTLTRMKLQMILQGIKLESVVYRKRYQQNG